MIEPITITLPAKMKLTLEDITRIEGISMTEVIQEAISQYLFLRQYRLLRQQLIPKAQAQGIFTDQDVFDRVS
jgi:hypothetical protein